MIALFRSFFKISDGESAIAKIVVIPLALIPCEEISSIESVRLRERIDEVKRKQFHCGSRVFFNSYVGEVTVITVSWTYG